MLAQSVSHGVGWMLRGSDMTLRIAGQNNWAEEDIPRGPEVTGPLSTLRAVVMLAGSVRSKAFHKHAGRSLLKMPVGGSLTVFDCWREQVSTLAQSIGIEDLPVRVMVNRGSEMRPGTERRGPLKISIEEDPSSLRGTAGLLSDIARAYNDQDQLLVVHAGQLLFEPLCDIVKSLANRGGDVALATDQAGVPSGMMLMRCGALRSIPAVGFVDLNEQALPDLARDHVVKIARQGTAASMSIRTLDSYIGALRAYHRRAANEQWVPGPYAEDWRSTYGIVEPQAQVDSSALVHDSVVLNGGRVEAGAVLVRSVVCPGGVVRKDQHIIDRVVEPEQVAGQVSASS